jgi:hypothetical protein
MNGFGLLIERESGDAYYVGPLRQAQALARRERHVTVVPPDDKAPVWRVKFFDDESRIGEAEWGNGKTEAEAWRFALGALFGPLDSEFDGPALAGALFGKVQS